VNSEVLPLESVAVAVIDCPTGTVLVAMKSLIEEVPLVLVVTFSNWPMKVLPSPGSRSLAADSSRIHRDLLGWVGAMGSAGCLPRQGGGE